MIQDSFVWEQVLKFRWAWEARIRHDLLFLSQKIRKWKGLRSCGWGSPCAPVQVFIYIYNIVNGRYKYTYIYIHMYIYIYIYVSVCM